MIAALAEQAKERGIPVMVVTGDRDAYQLVDDGVRIMSTSRGVTDTKVYDRDGGDRALRHPARARARTSSASRATRSDNIPGVPGIGDKTAADLLQKFGDLEGVLVQHRPDHRRQAQAEPGRARRQRAHVEACWRRWSATSRSTSTSRSSSRASRTARTCARSSATGSCAIRCAASRRRSRPPSSSRSRAPRTSTRSRSRPALARHPTDITRMKGDELVDHARGARGPRGRADPARADVALRGLRAAATSRSRGRPTTRAS